MVACCQTVVASSPGVEWWVCPSWQWQSVSLHHGPLTGTPLGGPSYFCCGCSLMEQAPSAWVSSPLSNWMALQLQRQLPLWMRPVVPLPTEVPSVSLPDSEVGQGLAVGPSQPNTVTPSHRQEYGGTGWVGRPDNQTSCWQVAENDTSESKAVLVGCVVIAHLLYPVVCLEHLKGFRHLPGKLLVIFMAKDLLEFPPPSWHLHMLGMPLYPDWLVQGRGLWVFAHWHWWGWQAISHLSASWGWLFPTQEFLEVGLQLLGTFQIFLSFAFP